MSLLSPWGPHLARSMLWEPLPRKFISEMEIRFAVFLPELGCGLIAEGSESTLK